MRAWYRASCAVADVDMDSRVEVTSPLSWCRWEPRALRDMVAISVPRL